MEFKIAGALSYFSASTFIGIWLILLLVAQPDSLSTFEAAKQTATYVLTQPGSEFFYISLASMLACIICGTLLFLNKYALQTMYVIILHSIGAFYIYDWTLAIDIALPLIFFNKIRANA